METKANSNAIQFRGIVESVFDVEQLESARGTTFYRQGFLLRECCQGKAQSLFAYAYASEPNARLAPMLGCMVEADIALHTVAHNGRYYNNLKCTAHRYVQPSL